MVVGSTEHNLLDHNPMDATLTADPATEACRPDQQDVSGLLAALTHCSLELELGNDLACVSSAVETLLQKCWWVATVAQRMRDGLTVALEEAVTNAIVHGNLEVCSGLREAGDGAYEKLIRLRRRKHPYASRRVRISCHFSRECASFHIRDDGRGFDPRTIPDPRSPERMMLPSGRGILLMRTFMDEVRYNAVGNAVTLVKKREMSERPTANGVGSLS